MQRRSSRPGHGKRSVWRSGWRDEARTPGGEEGRGMASLLQAQHEQQQVDADAAVAMQGGLWRRQGEI